MGCLLVWQVLSEGSFPWHVHQFFRELFFAELMAADDRWILKGGTNLYCRIPVARHAQHGPKVSSRSLKAPEKTIKQAKCRYIGTSRFIDVGCIYIMLYILGKASR